MCFKDTNFQSPPSSHPVEGHRPPSNVPHHQNFVSAPVQLLYKHVYTCRSIFPYSLWTTGARTNGQSNYNYCKKQINGNPP
jgi:hypothetical protein